MAWKKYFRDANLSPLSGEKVPNLEDEARREQEAQDMRKRNRNRKGRRSTILTTPDYEDTDATTNQPTLLGG